MPGMGAAPPPAAAAAGKKPSRRSRPVPPERYCRVRKAQAKLAAARATGRAGHRQGRAGRREGRGDRAEHHRPGLAADGDPQRQAAVLYNPQQVLSEDLLVIATELTDDRWGSTPIYGLVRADDDPRPKTPAALILLAHQAPRPPRRPPRTAGTPRKSRATGSSWRWPMPGTPRVWWRLDSPQTLSSGWLLSSTVPVA